MSAEDRVRRIALAVHSVRTLDELAGELQDLLLALGGGGAFSILFGAAGGLTVYRSSDPELPTGLAFPLGSDPVSAAFRDGAVFQADADPPVVAWSGKPARLGACFPLAFRDERYGAWVLHDSYPPEARRDLETLAEQLAVSVVRVQLLDEATRDHAMDAAKLAAIGQTGDLLRNLDLELILVKVVELALSIVSAEVGSLLMLEEGKGLTTRVEWGLPEAIIGAVRTAEGRRLIDQVVEQREPLLSRCVAEDRRLVVEGIGANLASLLVIPLATKGRSLGCLCIVNSAGAQFTARDLDILMTIAGLASTAMENALLHREALEKERFREQLRLAGEIQKKLLPDQAPVFAGGTIEGWSLPCDDSGGDYYDFFVLDDTRVAFCVGDVTGHGIAAALLMTTARAFLRAYVPMVPDLGQLFVRLNDLLARDMGDRFITLFFGVYDAAARTLTYTSAGHDPPLLYRRGQDVVEELDSTGMPLGMMAGMEFPAVTIGGLADGDLLLSMTDGVVEAMNPANEIFGRERVTEVLRAQKDAAPSALIAAIQGAVKEYSGTAPQRDDVTMVCLRVGPGGA